MSLKDEMTKTFLQVIKGEVITANVSLKIGQISIGACGGGYYGKK